MNIHDITKQIRAFADELDATKTPEKPDDSPPWVEWHGGECPLRDDEVEEFEFKTRTGSSGLLETPSAWRWSHDGNCGDIIAYRVLKAKKPAPKQPLGPSDVPIGSVFTNQTDGSYYTPCLVSHAIDGIYFHDTEAFRKTYKELQAEGWKINRPKHRDADGNPTLWEACEK